MVTSIIINNNCFRMVTPIINNCFRMVTPINFIININELVTLNFILVNLSFSEIVFKLSILGGGDNMKGVTIENALLCIG